MSIHSKLKTIRKMTAAEGYLELGLPHRAERELHDLKPTAPLEGVFQLLLGEAL